MTEGRGSNRFHSGEFSLAILLLIALLFVVGCGFEPSFDPPYNTVKTYVYAYNQNDSVLMKKCGFSCDLYKVFRQRIDVGVGQPKYEPVYDIKAELMYKEWARPKQTRQFTNERIFLTVHFTSESDPTYDVQEKLLLVKRRSTFTDFREPVRWQLMPLEAAKAEDAGDVPFS